MPKASPQVRLWIACAVAFGLGAVTPALTGAASPTSATSGARAAARPTPAGPNARGPARASNSKAKDAPRPGGARARTTPGGHVAPGGTRNSARGGGAPSGPSGQRAGASPKGGAPARSRGAVVTDAMRDELLSVQVLEQRKRAARVEVERADRRDAAERAGDSVRIATNSSPHVELPAALTERPPEPAPRNGKAAPQAGRGAANAPRRGRGAQPAGGGKAGQGKAKGKGQ